jgi:hypothetical protein
MSKTLFVCAKARINAHVGESYDEILEVETTPTTETIDRWGSAIMRSIRSLHQQDKAAGGDGLVKAYLDGASPYNQILMNLQIIMKQEDGINIELPYLPSDLFKVEDSETKEILNRIGEKG